VAQGKRWETPAITAIGEPQGSTQGSHEESITEHYLGYPARRSGLSEYRVEHPRWRFWPARTMRFEADVATLYGPQFVEALSAPPVSAFIAEGSHVEVLRAIARDASCHPELRRRRGTSLAQTASSCWEDSCLDVRA
jgi:hypothetical protein